MGHIFELHVSPHGRDADPGTRDRPVASLERARDLLRSRSSAHDQPRVVYLHAGVYRRDRAFVLAAQDSGTAGAPIVYQALDGHGAVLSGATAIDIAAFQPVRSRRILRRILSPAAQSRLLQVDLRLAGIDHIGRLERRGFDLPVPQPPLELFVDGRRMTRCRWPKRGTMRMREIVHPRIDSSRARVRRRGGSFTLDTDRAQRWRSARDVWLDGVFGKPWVWSYNRIGAVSRDGREISLAYPEKDELRLDGRNSFFAENLLEEMDTPGEYCVDFAAGLLYFLPPPSFLGRGAVVEVSTLGEPLLHLRGVSHVHFRNLVFDGGRATGAVVDGGAQCAFDGCEIRNCGLDGLRLTGSAHAAKHCHIHSVGGAGVVLEGGDRGTLAPGELLVESCHVHHWAGWQRVYAPAVDLGGVGNAMRHCLVHDGPHAAVLIQGNDQRVEYNEIHSVATDFEDCGAVYVNLGRHPLRRGHVIRNNWFHDIGQSRSAVHAVYLDNATMGVRVEGNLFSRIGAMASSDVHAIKCNGTSDVVVRGNAFVDCRSCYLQSFFLAGWGAKHRDGFERAWEQASADLSSGPHRDRYPDLARFAVEDRIRPASNVFAHNAITNPTAPPADANPFRVEYGPAALVNTDGNWLAPPHIFPGDADALRALPEIDASSGIPGFQPIPLHLIGPRPRD